MVLNSQTLVLLTGKYLSLKKKNAVVIGYKIVSKILDLSSLQCIHFDFSVSFTPSVLIGKKEKNQREVVDLISCQILPGEIFEAHIFAAVPLVKLFCCGQMTEEDKGREDGSAADGRVVIKDTKLRR